ncbi:MAG: hypothetical protein ABIK65_04420 [Candidatus Eisenbacteria bacterium]
MDPDPSGGSKRAEIRLREEARRSGIRKGRAVCALTSPRVDIFPVHVDAGAPGDPVAAVVEQARRHLGNRISESVLDYALLPEEVNRQGEKATAALVFAADRALVNRLLERLESIGVEVDRLLTPACVLAPRVVASEPGTRNILIATAEQSTSVSVVQNGHVLLERILSWGVRDLIARLRSELELDEAQCRRLLVGGPVEAEGDEDPDDDTPDPMTAALQQVLDPDFQGMAREAGGCLGYCNSFFRSAGTAAAVLIGPLANCDPLRTLLERRLGLPVLDARDGLDIPGLEEGEDAGPFATAACSALWPRGEGP